MNFQSEEGYSILVKNVTVYELMNYKKWLDDKSYGGNMGYILFPSKLDGKVTMFIDSGFNHTWRNTILPDLKEYWGEDRIIHEMVLFDDNGNEIH